MFDYFITFRISDKTIKGLTYENRRQSLIDAAKKAGGGYWEETTSFILTQSPLHTAPFTQSLSKKLSHNHDLIVVFDPSDMSSCYFGNLEYIAVLKSFFPQLKKCP